MDLKIPINVILNGNERRLTLKAVILTEENVERAISNLELI